MFDCNKAVYICWYVSQLTSAQWAHPDAPVESVTWLWCHVPHCHDGHECHELSRNNTLSVAIPTIVKIQSSTSPEWSQCPRISIR